MCASNELPAIPAPTEKEEPFRIGDVLTIYEAAMVYSGRHPYPYFFDVKGRGIKEHLEFLRLGLVQSSPRKRMRAQRSWDIYCELIRRIEQSRIQPVKLASDPLGGIDPCRTRIRTSDLADLAKERGEKPRYLRHLPINLPSEESETVQTEATLSDPSGGRATQRIATRPARELAEMALDEIYPEGIPGQSEEPNKTLCGKVGDWLKTKKQRDVSKPTILRAAGRRS
jgi:hypothetical protein